MSMNINPEIAVLTKEGRQNVYGIKTFTIPPQCLVDPVLNEDLVRLKYYNDNLPAGPYTEGCRVFNSANINIPNAVWTNLTFDSERYDTDSIHSLVANTDRLTCQTAGVYVMTGHILYANVAGGVRRVAIYLNGATFIAINTVNNIGGWNELVNITTIYKLAVGDFVVLQAMQNSGGAINVLNFGNISPEFMMQRIG